MCSLHGYILTTIAGFGGSASNRGNSGPFFIGSGLEVVSLLVTYFFIHPLTVDGMRAEDEDVSPS